jgi:hypothetical protein
MFNGIRFEGRWINDIESNFKVDTRKGIALLEAGNEHGEA